MISIFSVWLDGISWGRDTLVAWVLYKKSSSKERSSSGLTILTFLGLLMMNETMLSAAPVPMPQKPFHLADHVDWVSNVTFSPDGKLFAVLGSWSTEGRMLFFTYPDGRLHRVLKIPYDHLLGTLAFSPDGKRIAVACYSAVQVWDVVEGKLLMNEKEAHGDRVHSLCFSRDGKIMITGGRDNEVKVWDASTWKLRATFRLPLGIGSWRPKDDETNIKSRPRPPLFVELKMPIECLDRVVLLSDNKTVAAATEDKHVFFWDVTTGENLRSLKTDHPAKVVIELAISSDGRLLATGGKKEDGTVRLWNLADHSKRRIVLNTHNDSATTRILFSSDGKVLMSKGVGSKGHTSVTVWDLLKVEERFTLEGEIDQEDILCCTLAPDRKLASVFGGFEKPPRLRFFNLATGLELPIGLK